MLFRRITDDRLAQNAYLIGCQRSGEALLVDPERDVDRYLAAAADEGLRIVAVTETHIHADFLSGTRELTARDPEIDCYLSDRGGEDWSYRWAAERTTLLGDGDAFSIGGIRVRALHTPGHTPEHLSFEITDAGRDEPIGVLTGDFVFVGDLGRPDLLESAAGVAGAMEPSARRLHASTLKFLEGADHLQLWPGHGAGSACGKALGAIPQSTLGYERRHSPAIGAALASESAFVDYILDGQPAPPLYFARMKRLNRDGAPLLGELPVPRESPLRGEASVIDTRPRRAWLEGHAPGAIHAPFDRSFPTIVGSYVDPESELQLVIEPSAVEQAVRALVRIGYDRVASYVAPQEAPAGGRATTAISFDELAALERPTVLDVRGAGEYAAGHLDGALHIPHTRLAARLDELPRGERIHVHCRSGARAAAATSLLEREGFDVVLVDGMYPGAA